MDKGSIRTLIRANMANRAIGRGSRAARRALLQFDRLIDTGNLIPARVEPRKAIFLRSN